MTAPSAQPGNWVDPYRAYTFKLLINGITEGHFTEVGNLGITVPVIRYAEAGSNATVKAVPGPVGYSLVRLRWGVTSSTEVWDWMMATVEGRVSRREISIVMLDPSGSLEVLRLNLYRAWACEWFGAPLNASSQELAIETLMVAHEGIERVLGSSASTA